MKNSGKEKDHEKVSGGATAVNLDVLVCALKNGGLNLTL